MGGGGEASPVGILGGTFNPPHRGHVALAEHALRELALDRVLLMPAHIAPHKLAEEDPGAEHRLRMCELAAAGAGGLEACGMELARPAPSYTVDTLNALHESHPEARLTFILGADTACTVPSWREPERILRLARLAVADRGGSSRQRVLDAIAPLLAGGGQGEQALGEHVSVLEMPPVEISSSEVRARVARGEPVAELVGQRVAEYIAEHGLYRPGGGEAGS